MLWMFLSCSLNFVVSIEDILCLAREYEGCHKGKKYMPTLCREMLGTWYRYMSSVESLGCVAGEEVFLRTILSFTSTAILNLCNAQHLYRPWESPELWLGCTQMGT